MKVITFFNSKGGVGKTTTVYHVAWMLSEMGIKSIAIDFDPQSNLTSMFLPDDRLEEIYEAEKPCTVSKSVEPVTAGKPYQPVHIETITDNLGLVAGDLALSTFEDNLSDAWLKCLDGDSYSFRIMSIFNTLIKDVARRFNAEYILIDVGPNLGSINRAVLLSSDYMIVPVVSDIFSRQAIKSIGITLQKWKYQWEIRLKQAPEEKIFSIPQKDIKPAGYIVMQYSVKESRLAQSYLCWAKQIPRIFKEYVLNDNTLTDDTVEEDPNCIGLLKHYRSLAPMSMEAHKPIFLLKPADGAIGAHLYAVQKSYEEFRSFTERIIDHCQ